MTLFDLYFEMLTLADARLINSRKAKVETRRQLQLFTWEIIYMEIKPTGFTEGLDMGGEK